MPIIPIRVFFEKRSRVKYISHLDTMRAFTRALSRSRLPIWYTEGFNPHIYLTFALPLSLGYESLCESFDTRLIREMGLEECREALNRVLPEGMKVLRVEHPVQDATAITFADYDIRLIWPGESPAMLEQNWRDFQLLPVIEVEKKSKKGMRTVDIGPNVRVLESAFSHEERTLRMTLRCAAGSSLNINPSLYLGAFYSFADARPEGVKIVRTAILDAKEQPFT